MLNPIRKLAGLTDKDKQKAEAARPEMNIQELRAEVAELTTKVDELSVMCEVLARIALDKNHVGEAELMQLIELEKVAEAERQAAKSKCPQCGRQIDKVHKKCIFCG